MNARTEMISFARDALGLAEPVDIHLSPLGSRGSDRTYFRLRWNRADSAILVSYDAGRVENKYFADIAEFLRGIGVPTPRLFRHDPLACLIIMEDLGDEDLWSCRTAPWESRRQLYQETLAIIDRLHSFPTKDFPAERVRLMEGFSPDLYRWERDYFREHFVSEFCPTEVEPLFAEELEKELSALAERLERGSKCLVHRDLQSQNVMIRDGEPLLIDFQGMRTGSPFYDLGSLLCDPYVSFSDEERNDLLLFYYGLSKRDLGWTAFRTRFWEASAQRLMQALGAYGFLGLRKGLRTYLEYVPAGLGNLRKAAALAGSVPRLTELSQACLQHP